MAYSSIIKPSDYFNTKLWTGNSGSQTISGYGFQPDFLWTKVRSDVDSHQLRDAVRTINKVVRSNTTGAEYTVTSAGTFNSDGFTTVGTDGGEFNYNSYTYASWGWKANGAGVSNTEGDITATVSANTTSGFSIIKFTSAGSVSQTYGHGLNGTPKLWIIKDTSQSSNNWQVYYQGTDRLKLDTGEATSTTAAYLMSANATTITTPSNSDSAWGNGSGINYITYAFQEIKGFSKIGKYTGNGSVDGPFIYTGMSPAIIIAKKTSGVGDWIIWDNKRDGYNETLKRLYPNDTAAEESSTTQGVDFLSNGFKLKGTTSNAWNSGGDTYIYMAFSEEPFVANVDGGLPTTAR